MTIGPKTWAGLEAGPSVGGSTRLRLHPKSGHDLFLSVVKPDLHRRLVLLVPSLPALPGDSIRDSRGIHVGVEHVDDGTLALVVELADRLFAPVFDPLVTDIAAAAARAPSAEVAAAELLLRLDFWRSLLHDLGSGGMPTTKRRGLAGELYCLEHVLVGLGAVPALKVVQAWTGPLAANQDFQFPGGAIEVKTTTAKKPHSLIITSERELDSTGAGILLLIGVSLDERRGGAGRSLNAIVADARHALADPAAVQLLDERLAAYGYLPGHTDQYDEPRYTVRDGSAWYVRDAFPRIVESELRPGVGDVKYHVVTAGLEQYAVDLADVAAAVKGNAP